MKPEPEYHSYLVRLWRSDQAGERGELPAWLGELLHIQSGLKYAFQDPDEFFRYLQEQLDDDNDDEFI